MSTTLRFAACETQTCVNITIIESVAVDRKVETFVVALERTPDLPDRIILDAVNGSITILDNEGIYVLQFLHRVCK